MLLEPYTNRTYKQNGVKDFIDATQWQFKAGFGEILPPCTWVGRKKLLENGPTNNDKFPFCCEKPALKPATGVASWHQLH